MTECIGSEAHLRPKKGASKKNDSTPNLTFPAIFRDYSEYNRDLILRHFFLSVFLLFSIFFVFTCYIPVYFSVYPYISRGLPRGAGGSTARNRGPREFLCHQRLIKPGRTAKDAGPRLFRRNQRPAKPCRTAKDAGPRLFRRNHAPVMAGWAERKSNPRLSLCNIPQFRPAEQGPGGAKQKAAGISLSTEGSAYSLTPHSVINHTRFTPPSFRARAASSMVVPVV